MPRNKTLLESLHDKTRRNFELWLPNKGWQSLDVLTNRIPRGDGAQRMLRAGLDAKDDDARQQGQEMLTEEVLDLMFAEGLVEIRDDANGRRVSLMPTATDTPNVPALAALAEDAAEGEMEVLTPASAAPSEADVETSVGATQEEWKAATPAATPALAEGIIAACPGDDTDVEEVQPPDSGAAPAEATVAATVGSAPKVEMESAAPAPATACVPVELVTGELTCHPLTSRLPPLPAAKFDDLLRDIDVNGQLEAIWVHQGVILDGAHRYRACKQLGRPVKVRHWDGKGSVVDLILALNATRRHMTVSQEALFAAEAMELYKEEAEQRMRAGRKIDPMAYLPQGPARAQAAALGNVSERYVQDAARVAKEGHPLVVAAVRTGELKVAAAAELLQLAKAKQGRIMKKGRKAVRDTVRNLREQKSKGRAQRRAQEGPQAQKVEKGGEKTDQQAASTPPVVLPLPVTAKGLVDVLVACMNPGEVARLLEEATAELQSRAEGGAATSTEGEEAA
jgi:ParB-like chromosome segregation protein Spo0J